MREKCQAAANHAAMPCSFVVAFACVFCEREWARGELNKATSSRPSSQNPSCFRVLSPFSLPSHHTHTHPSSTHTFHKVYSFTRDVQATAGGRARQRWPARASSSSWRRGGRLWPWRQGPWWTRRRRQDAPPFRSSGGEAAGHARARDGDASKAGGGGSPSTRYIYTTLGPKILCPFTLPTPTLHIHNTLPKQAPNPSSTPAGNARPFNRCLCPKSPSRAWDKTASRR